jgi:CHAT domain-containing protein/tetratricopeptide (TPR) repeat protein
MSLHHLRDDEFLVSLQQGHRRSLDLLEPRASPDIKKSQVHAEWAEKPTRRRLILNNVFSSSVRSAEAGLWVQSVLETPLDHEARLRRLMVAADVILELSMDLGASEDDLQYGTGFILEAMSLIADDTELFPHCLRVYCALSISHFDSSLDPTHLENAIHSISLHQRVLDANPELLNLHGTLLLRRALHWQSGDDLRNGLQMLENYVSHDNVELRCKIYALSNLAWSYTYSSEFDDMQGDTVALLDRAVFHAEQARRMIPQPNNGTFDEAFVLAALSHSKYRRYEHQQHSDELLEAIEIGEQAVRLSRDNDPNKAKWMNNLGLALKDRFRISADLSWLERATRYFYNSHKLSAEGTRTHSLSLSNIANSFGYRYEWTGEREALDIAVAKYRALAELNNTNPTEWAHHLLNLGNILITAYLRYLRDELVHESISALELALNKYPESHRDVATAHSLICFALISRYRSLKAKDAKQSIIEEAIDHGKKSIKPLEQIGPRVTHHHYVLADAYSIKWDGSNRTSEEDLRNALDHSEKGLALTSKDSPDRALYLVQHAKLLMAKMSENDTVTRESLGTPLGLLLEAIELRQASPLVRIEAARRAINIHVWPSEYKWNEARSIGLQALELLPLVCGKHLSPKDQQHVVAQTSGLAAEVCSLLLRLGEPERALESLEASRAMILGFIIDNNDEILSLTASRKDLADKFTQIRRKLHIPPQQQGSPLGETILRERTQAEKDLSTCLDEIRELDGFHEFLRAPSIDHMKTKCLEKGIIIIVNVSYMGCDAIVLMKSKDSNIKHVRLPELNSLMVRHSRMHLSSSSSLVGSLAGYDRGFEPVFERVPIQPQQESSELLDWLWSSFVCPIFDELGVSKITVGSDVELHRVWWIASGAAAGLPFHAAAPKSRPTEGALSFTVPSYAPSMKALLHSFQCSSQSSASPNREENGKLNMSIITMKTSPGGYNNLPGVQNEKEVLLNAIGNRWDCIDLSQPSADRALQALSSSDIVHFACHGVANIGDPSESHLILEKCAGDGGGKTVDKLTVSQLMALKQLERPWIAYLSACTTATMDTLRLGDEGLHISGALQGAGFPHVVGSLWKVDDKIAADVAHVFYCNLVKARGRVEDRQVAMALREAVLFVQKKRSGAWSNWAGYIHSGA